MFKGHHNFGGRKQKERQKWHNVIDKFEREKEKERACLF
jgi:hypothetical protein